MINSSAYTRVSGSLDLLDHGDPSASISTATSTSTPAKVASTQVEKSSFTYFVQAYLHQLMQQSGKSPQEKNLCCRELGRTIGKRVAEYLSEGMVEKFALRDSKTVKYQQEVKFICENVWLELFGRKVDKLQFAGATNTFTFLDWNFRLIRHISHPDYEVEQRFTALNFELTCGIIEGVASRFGHEAEVRYHDKAQSEFELRFRTPGDTQYFSTY